MSSEIDVDRFYRLIREVYDMVMLHEIESVPDGYMKDLTFHEIHTIENIGVNPGVTMSELASIANVTTSTMTTMVDKLVKRGFARRRRKESDRRVVVVSLTEKGQKAFEEHNELHKKVGEGLLALMNDREKRVVFELYEKISRLSRGDDED